MIQAKMAPNISSIAEPGEARLPKRPASKARFNFPKPRRSWRDKREAEHRSEP
jgi:hypothetical protein